MIYAYGLSQQGTYHIKKGIVCQDAHRYVKCSDNMAVAAVADGLGSERCSHIASNIAVDISVKYCAENIGSDVSEHEILYGISNAFELAQKKVEDTAHENGHDLDQYDTTLSLAVLIRGTLYYGHSGDSGIIAYTTDGRFVSVTKQQRDEDNRVFPLYFGREKWEFGKFEHQVASVLLATDGILELLFPIYIRDEEVSIYTALANFFMASESMQIEVSGEDVIRAQMESFIRDIPDSQVSDDKTILVLLDASMSVNRQAEEYYAEPDWKNLRRNYEEQWRRLAYPKLFND